MCNPDSSIPYRQNRVPNAAFSTGEGIPFCCRAYQCTKSLHSLSPTGLSYSFCSFSNPFSFLHIANSFANILCFVTFYIAIANNPHTFVKIGTNSVNKFSPQNKLATAQPICVVKKNILIMQKKLFDLSEVAVSG